MRVSMRMEGDALTFAFELDEGEPTPVRAIRQGITMGRHEASVWLPPEWSLDDIHPDLLGLTILLLCQPYTNGTLRLPVAVSPLFAEKALSGMDTQLSPIDPLLAPRQAPPDGVPALHFSAGVDSFAALAVLPRETELFFLDRVVPEGAKAGLYKSAAAYHAMDVLREQHARHVWRIRTDLEFLRTPVGFPLDISNAVPTVLMADHRRLNAQGWGTVLESGYRIGTRIFLDYARNEDYVRHATVFAAAGLPYLQSVVGVSEVGTTMIERRSPYAELAQSCIRGLPGQPCMRCKKCFRKELLGRVLDGRPIDDELVDTLLASKEVQGYVEAAPIKHEDVVSYVLARYKGSHPVMKQLRRRVVRRRDSLDWLERWYPPSLDLLPERYRDDVEEGLNRYLKPMTRRQGKAVRAWDLDPILSSRRRRRARDRLRGLLGEAYPPVSDTSGPSGTSKPSSSAGTPDPADSPDPSGGDRGRRRRRAIGR